MREKRKQYMTTKKSVKSKVICVSHEEDADGISSAALIKQAFGGTSILVLSLIHI